MQAASRHLKRVVPETQLCLSQAVIDLQTGHLMKTCSCTGHVTWTLIQCARLTPAYIR